LLATDSEGGGGIRTQKLFTKGLMCKEIAEVIMRFLFGFLLVVSIFSQNASAISDNMIVVFPEDQDPADMVQLVNSGKAPELINSAGLQDFHTPDLSKYRGTKDLFLVQISFDQGDPRKGYYFGYFDDVEEASFMFEEVKRRFDNDQNVGAITVKTYLWKGPSKFTAFVKEVREFFYQTGRWIKEDGPQAVQMPFHLLKLGILILLGAKVF